MTATRSTTAPPARTARLRRVRRAASTRLGARPAQSASGARGSGSSSSGMPLSSPRTTTRSAQTGWAPHTASRLPRAAWMLSGDAQSVDASAEIRRAVRQAGAGQVERSGFERVCKSLQPQPRCGGGEGRNGLALPIHGNKAQIQQRERRTDDGQHVQQQDAPRGTTRQATRGGQRRGGSVSQRHWSRCRRPYCSRARRVKSGRAHAGFVGRQSAFAGRRRCENTKGRPSFRAGPSSVQLVSSVQLGRL